MMQYIFAYSACVFLLFDLEALPALSAVVLLVSFLLAVIFTSGECPVIEPKSSKSSMPGNAHIDKLETFVRCNPINIGLYADYS